MLARSSLNFYKNFKSFFLFFFGGGLPLAVAYIGHKKTSHYEGKEKQSDQVEERSLQADSDLIVDSLRPSEFVCLGKGEKGEGMWNGCWVQVFIYVF